MNRSQQVVYLCLTCWLLPGFTLLAQDRVVLEAEELWMESEIESSSESFLVFDESNSGGGGESSGDEGGVDPSDPTQVAFHVMTEFEWQKLNNNDGDLLAFKVSPFIPIEVAEQKFLFNFEIPLPQYAGLTDVGHDTGIGDTRLKFFWLIGTEQEFMRAIVPSFDAVAPTGDSDTGLGGGQWILMPNVVFALQPAENLAIYPFFRYVHSDGVRPTFVPEYGLPQDIFNDVLNQENIRGFNLEVPVVFSLNEAVMDWVSVTPDYFQNFTGQRGSTLTMKYDTGVALSESLFLIAEFWHPVAGEVTSDYTFKLKLDWYPPTIGQLCGRNCR